MNDMPAAEVEVTEALVRELLEEQHPDLARLDIQMIANGWDNAIYRLGDEFSVRLPRRRQAAELIAHEARWLPQLAPRLPLPVPAPVREGYPSEGYPWRWTVVPWFEGECVGTSGFVDPDRTAVQLGEFLAALHQPAPVDAPVNIYRGCPLAERNEITIPQMASLAGLIDVDAVRASWEEAVAVPPWHGAPTWIHGDLHSLNMIKNDGQLAAIIDFGDITSGDPATDLLMAWQVFDDPQREMFRRAAASTIRPIDDDMWQRSRGWAITHAIAMIANGANAPGLTAISLRTLAAVTGR